MSLSGEELSLIESRFRTTQWCNENVKDAIRLFHNNTSVDSYHRAVVVAEDHSIALDFYTGYSDQRQLSKSRTWVHKLPTTKTSSLLYCLPLAVGYPYMITVNIDVDDGLVNGAIGILRYIE